MKRLENKPLTIENDAGNDIPVVGSDKLPLGYSWLLLELWVGAYKRQKPVAADLDIWLDIRKKIRRSKIGDAIIFENVEADLVKSWNEEHHWEEWIDPIEGFREAVREMPDADEAAPLPAIAAG